MERSSVVLCGNLEDLSVCVAVPSPAACKPKNVQEVASKEHRLFDQWKQPADDENHVGFGFSHT